MNSKQIQEVTKQGIIYIDDNGKRKFIDFLECFETHLKWTLSAHTTTRRMAEAARQSKQVGEINYLGDIPESSTAENNVSQPYVMFYDSQLTRFEFANQNECAAFHQRVIEAGWSLFDLSD